MFNLKKIVAIGCVLGITSGSLFAENIMYAEVDGNLEKKVLKEAFTSPDLNRCEINKVKKVLAKMLMEQKNKSKSNSYKTLQKINIDEKKDMTCSEVKLSDSFIKFKNEKTFNTLYSINIYEYPIVGEPVVQKIKGNTSFVSKFYTKAGWVSIDVNNKMYWVKGYKLSPKFTNKTSIEDTKKWNSNCIKVVKK